MAPKKGAEIYDTNRFENSHFCEFPMQKSKFVLKIRRKGDFRIQNASRNYLTSKSPYCKRFLGYKNRYILKTTCSKTL